jgi:23S rRNA (adenine2030-N6)-methyltransferase
VLSYQHGFHVGNFADVLKHGVLCSVIDYLLQKDKPFYFHDTHAGRGKYNLQHPMSQKTGEYREGVDRILGKSGVPQALLPYVSTLKAFNPEGHLRTYAGSSLLAQKMMRAEDRLVATELHPQEYLALRDNAEGLRNLRVSKEDGYSALKAALPPKERRGVVLIDPSYELLADDSAVIEVLREAVKRFATGIYLLWYPIVDAGRTKKLLKAVATIPGDSILQLELFVREPLAGGSGMAGTGMLVLNPPWQLEEAMRDALPWLVKQLAPESGYCNVQIIQSKTPE